MSDYIKREDAIAYAKHAYAKGLNVLEYLDEVPAADVAPVGKWIAPNEFFDPKAYRKCSLCGMHFDIYPPYKAFDGRVCYPAVRVCNYCPNCGAKMEAEP